MRVLITVRPKMYRETLALTLHRHRPEAEVMLAPADSLAGPVTDFEPDLLLHNDDDRLPPEYLDTVPCRVEVLITDGMGARIDLNGRIREIEDMSVDDLLAVLDEAEGSLSGDPVG